MKINKSNIVKSFCAILLLGIIAMSCGQDPIFYIISSETAPVPPRIPGSPTNMVVFERKYRSNPSDPGSEKTISLLFVASGILHWYGRPLGTREPPTWDRHYNIPQPWGRIISLAATKDRLYALCLTGDSLIATLQYMGHTGGWKTIPLRSDYPFIQSIYADPDTNQLFAGACISNKTAITYVILYLDPNNNLQILKRNTSMLSGAAYRDSNDTYYLCTRGDGIFQVSKDSLETNTINDTTVSQLTIKKTDNRISFMGMIKLENSAQSIIAIGRFGGLLYEIDEGGAAHFSQMFYNNGFGVATGGYAMGALALWEDYTDGSVKKLVAGKQGTLYSTSYNNGYVEFYLNSDDKSFDKGNSAFFMDTVHGNFDRYSTSLVKQPVNHLFQVPATIDPNKTFFASTQTAGLWSYRDRFNNGGWQWNAEE